MNIKYKPLYLSLASIILPLLSSGISAENRALLIGIDHYQYVFPPLDGPTNDVTNIKRMAKTALNFKEHQIATLTNEAATKKNILKSIKEQLIEKTNTGDKVLFYFSGHGYQVADKNHDEKDKQDETLVSYDAAFKDNELINMVSDDDLRELFDQITDRHVTIIVDSCHSGTITRGLIPKAKASFIKSPTGIYSITRNLVDITKTSAYSAHRLEVPILESAKNRMVWSAATAGQKAHVDTTITPRQGVFTRWLIDGITNKRADSNNNQKVSNAELLQYTRLKSEQYCQDTSLCNEDLGLTPTLKAPAELLSASFSSHSQFTNPPDVTKIADEALIPLDQDSIQIDVEINERSTNQAHLKDELYISVESKKTGYLLLLDKNAKGELRQVYPNNPKQDNTIKRNKAVFIPINSSAYTVVATELGDSQLIALVTHDKLALDDLTKQTKDIQVIPNAKDYLVTLAERLQSTWTGGIGNRSVDYSLAKFDYKVIK